MTKQNRFQSQVNRIRLPEFHETIEGNSMTIQDDSYTIAEILFKSQQGIVPNIGRNVIYENVNDFDDYDPTRDPDFDLADLTEYQEKILESIEAKKQAKLEAARKKNDQLQAFNEDKDKDEDEPSDEPVEEPTGSSQ